MHRKLDKKIKIVIGVNSFTRGGTEKQLVEQLKVFDKNKFKFYLITLKQFKNKGNFYDLLPKHVETYKLDFKSFRDVSEWIALIKILKKIKPDIVMTSLFFSNTIFRMLKIFFKYRIISREHNVYTNKTRLKVLIDKLFSYLTFKIVAVSKTVAKFTANQEKINKNKFLVIHNGINLQEIKQFKEKYNKKNLKKELGFKQNDKIIINVARLIEQKNHKLLIDAFSEFSKIKDGYKLIIVGGGPRKEELEKQINDLGLKDKVFLLGERRNVFKFYIISEFFVLTSKKEGFPNVGIEAMAFGLPIISTKVGGMDECVKNYVNGFLVKSDARDICTRMLFLSNLNSKQLNLYKSQGC